MYFCGYTKEHFIIIYYNLSMKINIPTILFLFFINISNSELF